MSDRVERERILDLGDDLGQGTDTGVSSACAIVGSTTAISTYPTVAAAYYGIQPTEIDGQQDEGSVPTFVSISKVLLALNVGTKVPPSGTKVVVQPVGGRWVFRYDG